MQAIGLNVAGCIVAIVAMVVSVRYFLLSTPAGDGPVDRSRLLFGCIHPQMVLKSVFGAAMGCGCWLLSEELFARGDRILAGLALAAGVPAALFVALTLFAGTLVLVSKLGPASAPAVPARRVQKARVVTWLLLAAIIVAAALFPMLR